MSEIEIYIDPNGPAHLELEEGLRQSLRALTSISVKEEKKPVPPGTLTAGLDQVVAYVVQHPDKVLPLATAVLNILSNLLRFRSTKAAKGEKDKPVVIVVRDDRLSLPASEATQRKFLQKIEFAEAKPSEKKKNNKQSHRSTTRSKTSRAANKRRK